MIENAMSNFINHFSLDCALIIDLHAKEHRCFIMIRAVI